MPIFIKNVVIDPNGDAVLILRYPIYNLDFIPPPLQEDTPSTASTESSLPVNPADTSSIESLEGDLSDLSLDAVAETADNEGLYHDGPEFHYLVSTERLCVASPYFHNIFKHGFREAIPEDDGKYYFSAEDFQPEALEHVLNLAHSQEKDVPGKPTSVMLAHIAVIIDYYQMDIFLSQCLRRWRLEFFEYVYPVCHHNDAFLLLFVSLLFGWKNEFTSMLEWMVVNWSDFTQKVAPPFEAVLDRLFHHRRTHIGELDRKIDALEKANEGGYIGCSTKGCHSMIKQHIEWLRAQVQQLTPKDGASFENVVKEMRWGGTWYKTPYKSNKYPEVMRRTPCCFVYHPNQDPLSLTETIWRVRRGLNRLETKDFGFIMDDTKS